MELSTKLNIRILYDENGQLKLNNGIKEVDFVVDYVNVTKYKIIVEQIKWGNYD